MEGFLGWLTMVFSLAVIAIGTPYQIIKNYRNKSCEGLSLSNTALILGCNISWLAYGLERNDWVLIATNPFNVVLTSIILFQFFIYRKRKNA